MCTIVTITLCNKHFLDRKWIKFKNTTVIYYDKYPDESHELIQADEIEVEPAVNDILQQMENDIEQFGEHMHRYATDLENRMKRETKKHLLKNAEETGAASPIWDALQSPWLCHGRSTEPSVISRDRSTKSR